MQERVEMVNVLPIIKISTMRFIDLTLSSEEKLLIELHILLDFLINFFTHETVRSFNRSTQSSCVLLARHPVCWSPHFRFAA